MNNSPLAGAMYASVGVTCYEWNQLEKASSYFLRSIQLSSLGGHNAGEVLHLIALGRTNQEIAGQLGILP